MDETNETKKAKVNYFFKCFVTVHVDIKGKFYNGTIKEVNDDCFIIEDRKLGKIPVFYSEMLNIEPYRMVGI